MSVIQEKLNIEVPVIKQLCVILGSENVLTSIEDRYSYAFDTGSVCNDKLYLPDVVVLPENTSQISEILKLANQNNIPVTTRAAGTNHAGGCVPVKGGIVVHLSRMNKILEIDKENLKCRVQPGVVVETLQKAVDKDGLFYPPDPANLKVSTIGGSLGMSSSGPRAFKYGGTKDYVLELEVVLADGTIMKTGSQTAKNVTGYNLTQLFIGSEGTLGVVTEATLRLITKPEAQRVILSFFDSVDKAANAVTEIISSRLTPSTLDLIDRATIQTIEKFYSTGLLVDMEAALIIEIDGFESTIESQVKQVVDICTGLGASQVRISFNEEEAEKIWFARRSAFGAVAKLGPNVITEDAVVPRSKVPKMVKEIRRICDKYNIKACIMGHAGDGNIHPNFSLDLRNEEEAIRFQMAIDELFEVAIKLGGTLSGEHGIGMNKAKYMDKAVDKAAFEYMKGIKKLFDPKGILNPGKFL